MEKKILFFSSIIPDTTYYKNSIGATSTANDSLQRAIMRGFEENGYYIDIINVPNIGAYPTRYHKLLVKKGKINITKKIKGNTIGFFNMPILKHAFIYRNIKQQLKQYEITEYDAIFIYDCYVPFLKTLKRIKHISNIKTILFMPDLIGFTGNRDNLIISHLTKVARKELESTSYLIDIFILVSEGMKSKVNISQKQSLIVEGVWDDKINLFPIRNKSADRKYIFYGGSLGARHGILNLVEAFNNANLVDVDLVICGEGETKNEIQRLASLNNRIKYKGQLSRTEILKLQSEAYLLVNPRNSSGEFTNYSFPSKILEYFTSGTPTFMYKLKGIPDEYYNYCFSIKDESIQALSKCLIYIFQTNPEELMQKAIQARKFILENKTSKIQIERVIEMIK